MKIPLVLLAASLLLSGVCSQAQINPENGQPGGPPFRGFVPPGATTQHADNLYRFDLDFPGGEPGELVKAIQNQHTSEGRTVPLNVIIPDANAHSELPPLHVKGVNVPELFEALNQVSKKTFRVTPGNSEYYENYTFTTAGPAKNDSIWFFRAVRLPTQLMAWKPESACRFFQLRGYLDAYKIEDITTAVQTGWKMFGDGSEPPALSFHKETTLLIAVGEPRKVDMINEVLRQLDMGMQLQAARKSNHTEPEAAKPSGAARVPPAKE